MRLLREQLDILVVLILVLVIVIVLLVIAPALRHEHLQDLQPEEGVRPRALVLLGSGGEVRFGSAGDARRLFGVASAVAPPFSFPSPVAVAAAGFAARFFASAAALAASAFAVAVAAVVAVAVAARLMGGTATGGARVDLGELGHAAPRVLPDRERHGGARGERYGARAAKTRSAREISSRRARGAGASVGSRSAREAGRGLAASLF